MIHINEKYIFQKNWVKTAIPAFSSSQTNLHPPIWGPSRQLDDHHRNANMNNKDHQVVCDPAPVCKVHKNQQKRILGVRIMHNLQQYPVGNIETHIDKDFGAKHLRNEIDPKFLSLLSNQSLLRPVRCNWFLWEEILASRLPDLLLIECLPWDGDRQSSPSFSPPRQYQRTRRRKLFWISFCNKSTWHKTSSPLASNNKDGSHF